MENQTLSSARQMLNFTSMPFSEDQIKEQNIHDMTILLCYFIYYIVILNIQCLHVIYTVASLVLVLILSNNFCIWTKKSANSTFIQKKCLQQHKHIHLEKYKHIHLYTNLSPWGDFSRENKLVIIRVFIFENPQMFKKQEWFWHHIICQVIWLYLETELYVVVI